MRLSAIILIGLYGLLASGCLHDDDDDGSSVPDMGEPDTVTIQGTVLSPSVETARLGHAGAVRRLVAAFIPAAHADIIGLAPVPGATVELVRLDDNGDEIEILTSATSDSEGVFSIATAETLSANLLLRVGSGDVLMRAFATAESVDIDPASSFAVNAVLDAGQPLNRFSVDEINLLNQFINGYEVDVSGAVSAADALALLESADAGRAAALTEGFASDNLDESALSGTYRGGGLLQRAGHDGNDIRAGFKSVDFEAQFDGAGTVDLSQDVSVAELEMSLTTNPAGVSASSLASDAFAETFSLTYGLGGHHLLQASPDSTFRGLVSSNQAFIVLGPREYDLSDAPAIEQGLAVGIRQGSGLSDADLSGPYNFVSFQNAVVADSGAQTGVIRSDGEAGTFTFDEPAAGEATNVSETISVDLDIPGEISVSTLTNSGDSSPFSVADNGVVDFNNAAVDGQLSADGSLLVVDVFEEISTDEYIGEMILMSPQGSACDNSVLDGRYLFVGSNVSLYGGGQTASIDGAADLDVSFGRVDFDGTGTASFETSVTHSAELTLAEAGSPPALSAETVIDSGDVSYSVAADCSLEIPAVGIRGFVVTGEGYPGVVMTDHIDSGDSAHNGLIVGVKQTL